ncbi:MAG TPA: cytochrome C oxidase subunit IV family protein [Candidatus Sulfotelmatobacter sp.]|nr:cytochrome C oxidase subunit IV family protein [Candidatus Sulfotelmatobacter sp.]
MASEREPGFKFYVGIWIVMICIAGLEVILTYQHLPGRTFVGALLILAFVEGGIAIMYFMHMKYESPNLFWTLVPITIFVLFMLDHIWPDALRLARMNMFR